MFSIDKKLQKKISAFIVYSGSLRDNRSDRSNKILILADVFFSYIGVNCSRLIGIVSSVAPVPLS